MNGKVSARSAASVKQGAVRPQTLGDDAMKRTAMVLGALLVSVPVYAQPLPQTPPYDSTPPIPSISQKGDKTAKLVPETLPNLNEVDKITLLIDMLSRVQTAVKKISGDPLATYKRVGLRMINCATVYGLFSEDQKNDPSLRAWYSAASDIYAKVAAVLYPNIVDAVKQDTEAVLRDFAEAKSDRKAAFYLARNCRDLAQPNADTVYNAILELKLQK